MNEWIVIGEEKGKIKLVSKSDENTGILPKGSYITAENDGKRYVLRVDESGQTEPYSPSPLIIDMDLSPLVKDRTCQNQIYAHRVKDIDPGKRGLVDFIPPQSKARRSNQEEIDLALGLEEEDRGPPVFISTIQYATNQILEDENGKPIVTFLPRSMFFHQIMLCGKTGQGKTNATKYLMQYFAEEMGGAVLAINVKEDDLLKLYEKTKTTNKKVLGEWEILGKDAKGLENFSVYYPATTELKAAYNLDSEKCDLQNITLKLEEIEPETLNGLLKGQTTDTASRLLPDIFRFWKEKYGQNARFIDFVRYFMERGSQKGNVQFDLQDVRGEILNEVTIFRSTYTNLLNALRDVSPYFDDDDAKSINEEDIIRPGKVSVIDATSDEKSVKFAAILLRHLLKKIVHAKSSKKFDTPVLIVIDEVHKFYDTDSTTEALDDLDGICRTGRSMKIGVIFSSQSPSDIPRGLSSVINTQIFFKTNPDEIKIHGIKLDATEVESLKRGFACGSVFELPQLKFFKFPLTFCGDAGKGEDND